MKHIQTRANQLTLLAVLPGFSGGGAERVTLNLLNSLAARGSCVALLSFNGRGSFLQSLGPRVESHVLATGSLRSSLVKIVAGVRHLRPAVVFSTLGYVNVAILAMRVLFPRGTRVWVREANLPSISLPNNRFPQLMRWAYAGLYSSADMLICSSERMKEEFVSQFRIPSNRIRILPNPVDEQAIRLRATECSVVRVSGRCFVAAGRLTHQKGFDLLLEMFAEINDSESRLVILGEGLDENSLRQQARELDINARVLLVGFTDNPWAWFAAADVFLLPSRWEGMPNAALEALACGLPVIATPESGGITEVAAVAEPGAVQVVTAGRSFIEAMRKVTQRQKDELTPSLLPPQYRLESVTDTFISWLNKVD